MRATVVSAFVCVSSAFASGPGTKRGLVGGSCSYVNMFEPRARNWMYNYNVNLSRPVDRSWDTEECQAFAARSDFEFVPMMFNLDRLANASYGHMYAGSQHFLGMNEPSSTKNESGLAVAQGWKEIEAIADKFDVPLVVGTAAPGGLNLDKAKQWLDEFYESCGNLYGNEGCRTDFVAVHFYVCNGTTDETAEQSAKDMMTFLDDTYERYQRPLWLTEFNCGDGAPGNPLRNQTAANHLRFMKAALPKLEAAPHVERYSWFQIWQENSLAHPGENPGCALVNEDGSALTELGEFYSSFQYGGEGSALV